MKKLLFIFLLLLFYSSCQQQHSNNNHWIIAYKNDKAGKTLMGSKMQLINAIRKGASIKIGWGAKGKSHRIEHLSEPIWLAILDEQEVVAHLDPQVLSGIDWDNLSASYADSTLAQQEWRVVLTTKGEFDAIWYDREGNQLSKRRPQQHAMTWFVKDVDVVMKAPPFFE